MENKNIFDEAIKGAIENASAVTIHGSVISPTSTQIVDYDGESIKIKLPHEEDTFVTGVVKLKDIIAIISLGVTFDDHYKKVMDEKKKQEDELKKRIEEGQKEAEELQAANAKEESK